MYIECVWTRVKSSDARPVFVVDTFEGTGAESICNRRQAIRLQQQFVIFYKTLKCFHCCLRTQGLWYYTLSIKEALALLIVQIRKCSAPCIMCGVQIFASPKSARSSAMYEKCNAHIMCKSEKCDVQPMCGSSAKCSVHCTVYNVQCANLKSAMSIQVCRPHLTLPAVLAAASKLPESTHS